MPRGWGEVVWGCEEGMGGLGEGLHGQGSVGRTGVGRQLCTGTCMEDAAVLGIRLKISL